MQKIREIKCAVLEKNAENFRFWAFLTILAQNGLFWTDAAQNVQFSNFPGKNKTQKIPMRGFGENLMHGNERQTETRANL